jgi:hypothetical protein
VSPTIYPCYAASDREIAAAIGAFLERGTDVRVFLEEGALRPGQDLAEKAREARMADVVLVLFSRNSLPAPWPRSQWEDALVREPAEEGVRIGFVKCDDCAPPKVLKPQFELSGLALPGLRQLKRWVRHRGATYTPPGGLGSPAGTTDLEALGIAIADRPGSATLSGADLAFEFARAYREDFDEILALDCGDRTVAALAGDVASQLGLRLEGDLEANLGRLRDFCSARRFLVLLYNVLDPARELIFGGHCSTLIAEGSAADVPPLPSDPLRQAQHAFTHLDSSSDWPELCHLARQGLRHARDQGRIAECYELMLQWNTVAEVCGDRPVMDESARELLWILESWGRADEAQSVDYRRAAECDDQMMLPF